MSGHSVAVGRLRDYPDLEQALIAANLTAHVGALPTFHFDDLRRLADEHPEGFSVWLQAAPVVALRP